jgi:hypothetical protein
MERGAGTADYLLWPALYQSFASPLVYSPDNTAYSCLSIARDDQVQCTAAH